ncbi:MAG TPA: VOC family protein [Telluria sp.]|nr:VOC family protein [Telluria sp.]
MLGLRTVIYPVPDLERGKEWYAQVFGKQPYFDQPFYVGFEIGGFELGLLPEGEPGAAGCVAYWGVEDIDAEVARLTGLGATLVSGIEDVGEGIRVADLKDPFGNVLGLIKNPVFDPSKVR